MKAKLITAVIAILMCTPSLPALADDVVPVEFALCPGTEPDFGLDHDVDGIGDLCDDDAAFFQPGFDFTPRGELVIGTDLTDTMDGLQGDDALYGVEGDDILIGGPGNDVLVGGPGDDVLTGGLGCDVFPVDPAGDDFDTVTDFAPGVDRFAFEPDGEDPVVYTAEVSADGVLISFPE